MGGRAGLRIVYSNKKQDGAKMDQNVKANIFSRTREAWAQFLVNCAL